ncbi:MAG: NAD(P)H-dependent oxidoreductase [Sedimentisphaerales bacterium]|nr:NAD(P)H-dependent oxidoreductase [Sedimentisphaerales bacterium]
MIASVILAHPYSQSFNHAIFKTVIKTFNDINVEVYTHDLYEENFNPVLTRQELGSDNSNDFLVNRYANELVQSDILVYIHPNWWGQPPAILKGYIDRVIRSPYAYDFPEDDSGGGLPIEKLKGKYGIVYNTANTVEERENNYFSDPLDKIWGKCIFGFLGIDKYYRKMFRVIADSTENERLKWLQEIEDDIIAMIKNHSDFT